MKEFAFGQWVEIRENTNSLYTPLSKELCEMYVFRGNVECGRSTTNTKGEKDRGKYPLIPTNAVLCGSTVPLGEYGYYGKVSVLAHFSKDVFSVRKGSNREASKDAAFNQLEYEENVFKGYAFDADSVLENAYYDEIFFVLKEDDEMVAWHRDGCLPLVDGSIPLSELIEQQINRLPAQLKSKIQEYKEWAENNPFSFKD